MPRPRLQSAANLTIDEIVAFDEDIENALRLYFSESSPQFTQRFFGHTRAEIEELLARRIQESKLRSSLMVLTSLEATFRIDFSQRCARRLKDELSRYFRSMERAHRERIRLDEHILEGWKLHTEGAQQPISELRGHLKFRHWVAHGRYWTPKLAGKNDLESVLILAKAIRDNFPFVG
jgi:hypothetical protein